MITGELTNKIDGVWNDFWSDGISNPLEVIEQLTYRFASPSTAASVLVGGSANGRRSWKDPNGRTLRQIQEHRTNETASA